MSFITAQQTKLDLELVLKENRLDIGKCNGRIPRRLTPREPTFQVVLDAIALTPCYPAFLITADVPEMHQPWRTFTALINRGLSGKTSGLDKLRLSRAQILWESTQIYGAILPECLTSPVMKESKAYKTYLGYATGAVPPKMARKFKKASPSKKDSDLVLVDEEPVTKGKRVKRPAKKSTTKPTTGVVIREAPVETKSKSKEKEKVDVTHEKGIELLSEVALTEEAQMKEVRKNSLRDFHKTHPSGSGTVAEKPPSVDKITPTVTSEGTDDNNNDQDSSNEDSEQENESEEQVSDSEQEEESKDDDQEEEEFVHTSSPTDDKDNDNLESESDDVNKSNEESDDVNKSDDVIKGDKEIVQGEGADAEMIDAQQGNENLETTQEQVVEDAHVTISTVTKTKVPVTSSSCTSDLASKFLNFSDIPHTDAEIVSPLDVHVHHEVLRTQAPTLLTIPVFVITESSPVYTNIPQSSKTFTSPPILTTPNPSPKSKATNPLSTLPDFASVFRFNDRITTLEKEVAELKKDPLHTQVTTLVDEHLDTRLGETREEFMNFLSESLTARIKEQVKDQLPQILPKEVSNFAPPVIEALIKESRDKVTLPKVSSQPHSTYEAASTLTEFELKKILIDKIEKSESYLAAFKHRDCYDNKDKYEDPSARSDRGLKKRKLSKDAEPTTGPKKKDSTSGSSKGSKSQPKSSGKSVQSEEPVFEVADSDMPQDHEGNSSDNKDETRNETASRRDWFKKPTPPQEPNDPDWYVGKTTQEGPTQN
ncbi:hypothetical protein Tco_0718453 [Tanacetum coccineum]